MVFIHNLKCLGIPLLVSNPISTLFSTVLSSSDAESFVKGGPTFFFPLVDEGRDDQNTTKSRPSFAWQGNAFSMAFHLRAEDDPTLSVDLAAL